MHRSQLPLISLTKSAQVESPEPEGTQSSDEISPGYALYPYDTQSFRLQRVKLLSEMPDRTSEAGPMQSQYKTEQDSEFASDEDIIFGKISNSKGNNIHSLGRNETDDSQERLQRWVIDDEMTSGNVVATTVEGNAVDIYELLFGQVKDASGGARSTVTATYASQVSCTEAMQ